MLETQGRSRTSARLIPTMKRVFVRFYAELNDFLPPARRTRTLPYSFYVPPAVKDVIESFGVPHTEVDLVIVNGRSVGFDHLVEDGDRVAVYPVFESIDIRPELKVRPEPLRQTRFVLDTHLGRLAAYLRMLGFDTLYSNRMTDDELARLSRRQRRILLTRDRGLLKRSEVTHAHYIRETEPRAQLLEVVMRYDLAGSVAPFTRCLSCNSLLVPLEKSSLPDTLPQNLRQLHNSFWRCPGCGRLFWPGSHHRRMRQLMTAVLNQARDFSPSS